MRALLRTMLDDLKKAVTKLEDDMRRRSEDVPDIGADLRRRHAEAKVAGRTAAAYEVWREEFITQAAVAWTLGCVFVRFLEDNDFIPEAYLSGPGERLAQARDARTLYFRQFPTHSDREYLEFVFGRIAELPGARGIFDREHNPLWMLGPTGDGARLLLDLFQKIDAKTGALVLDFTGKKTDTRFLGDLYQDLSESARKRYALLQTPKFIEDFILDRTLTPAVAEFGYAKVKLIDPTCGSGHFLLGAFERLLNLHLKHSPNLDIRVLAQKALEQVHGVDVNPFAVAIARFRLLVAALVACDIGKIADAPDFEIRVFTGDSLLHGARAGETRGVQQNFLESDRLEHYYATEDAPRLAEILGGHYHAVVGNPPYITPKDPALNQAYRQKYGSCHMKYSLGVPFMERFFDLSLGSLGSLEGLEGRERPEVGYVGMITANSFMKREFGKKLIETYIPTWDLTHVIDTSGAYIPGHGTPTVILFGRNRRPVVSTIRAVMGIKGEPSTPEDPARGFVWSAIVDQVDVAGSQSDFVSVSDAPRANFEKHPWSIGGGGASELKEVLDETASKVLGDVVEVIGVLGMTNADDILIAPKAAFQRKKVEPSTFSRLVLGDLIRDHIISDGEWVVFPYFEENLISLTDFPMLERWLWIGRNVLGSRVTFGKTTYFKEGRPWWEWHQVAISRLRTPLTITYAEIATHNHFVLDRGGKIFNRTSPVIKLPANAAEADHLALLGLLNSSTACFWIKQVCFNKGSTVDQHGARQRTMPFEDFYAHDGTKLKQFPISAEKPLTLATEIDRLALELQSNLPANLVERLWKEGTLDAARWAAGREAVRGILERMIALQEELDWECYRLYGLLDGGDFRLKIEDFRLGISLGQRAFEIVMARAMEKGELQTTWFERHGSTPVTEIPAEWPDEYKKVVARRIELMQTDPNIRLIEKPEYKRRWNVEPWDVQAERALRGWLLDRLEDLPVWAEATLRSTTQLADAVRGDADFMRVAEMYRKRPDFDVAKLVRELVEAETVPAVSVMRYKPSGLIKRKVWEDVWDLQRREDRGEAVGEIPVPPKYGSADFLSSDYWRLRGKLDVPKERFIGFPGMQRDGDPSGLLVGWAGWDHLKQARAVAGWFEQLRTGEGWTRSRLTPLLVALVELLPWLDQWHNDIDPEFSMRMGDFFREFVAEEARAAGLTLADLKTWVPPAMENKKRMKAEG